MMNWFSKRPAAADLREVISAVYGVSTAKQMIEVIYEDENLSVSGFISPPGLTRSNRREMLFYVNQRPVRIRL